MIDILLLFLTIIIILIITSLIYLIVKKKETFINETKEVKEAILKLDLQDNLINYEKGSKGYDGEKGIKGVTGRRGSDGLRGNIGESGKNGLHYGSLIFKNKNDEIIDELLNSKQNRQNNVNIIVPTGYQGDTGVVGTIEFINHKEEIIGSYYPPKNTHASTLSPIIIKVPEGFIGEDGDNGNNGKHPTGPIGETGEIGLNGETGERGEIGIDGEKGETGGGGDEDTFNNVKVNNKVCFKDEPTTCIDINILKVLVNYDDYIAQLEERRLRLIRQLCKLIFYEKYNLEKHPNYDELKIEYEKQLEEIYEYNNEDYIESEVITEQTCPIFPEKPECIYNNEDHLDETSEYLHEGCICKKLTTNCGTGMFIAREAYKGKDDKNGDIFVSDNKCSECTLKREHINIDKGEVYVGCDGVYDGIAAICDNDNEFINIDKEKVEGYECKPCETCQYKKPQSFKTGGCNGLENTICGECSKCNGDQYISKTCTEDGDVECTDCKTSCPDSEYLFGLCDGTQQISNSCKTCLQGHFCRNSEKYECTVCNSDYLEISRCTNNTDTVCVKWEYAWIESAEKFGSDYSKDAWRRNAMQYLHDGNNARYLLIMLGDDLIYSGWAAVFSESDTVVVKDDYRKIAYEFTRGKYEGKDDIKLDWAKDRIHESYRDTMNFGLNFTHWTQNDPYYSMTLRKAKW